MHTIRRDPRQLGETKTRWTLARLLHHCQQWGWKLTSCAGLCQLLHRLRLHWKRGRDHVHSPDPDYQAKVNWIATLRLQVRQSAGKQVLLYLDEMTYYRQPSVGYQYELAGTDRPHAHQSYRSNTKTRLVGALDACLGRVLFRQASKIGINELVALYQQIASAYPQAERIWVVQDNWPVHFHPDVLVALEPQESPFSFNPAPNWPEHPSKRAQKKWGDWHLPIQIVTLPSYASWLNPTEKLWRKLKQDVLHLHRWADNLETLRERVLDFFKPFACGSTELLQAVGLHIPN